MNDRTVARVLAVLVVALLAGCGIALKSTSAAKDTAGAAPTDVVTKSLKDVERFWTGAYPGLSDDGRFQPVAGLLLLRDQPGTPATDEQSHGNAFDRVRALQEGIEQGPSRCAAYSADNLPVTEVPFSSRSDADNGGNLPYDQALRQLAQDAQDYWSRTFPRLTGQKWTDLRVQAFNPKSPPNCTKPDEVAQPGRGGVGVAVARPRRREVRDDRVRPDRGVPRRCPEWPQRLPWLRKGNA